MTKTRRRRLLLVGAVLAFVVVLFDFGLFVREFDYQVARVGEVVTGSSVIQLPDSITGPENVPLGPNEIRIAAVGIRAPIMYTDVVDENQFQDLLMHGVVHYPKTAMAGESGNAFYFGHSSDYLWKNNPYSHVFSLLPHVKKGDLIEVTNAEGIVFTYRVTETFIVSPKDLRVLDQGDGTQSLLTLQTSYPLGTALARFIVRAELSPETP